jgi:AAA15 family ATPase/GTPase
MIQKLSVKNFKSVKELDMDCRKINLLIGEPNTGKSNILETLGLLSWCGHSLAGSLRDYVRYQYMHNLFYDELIKESVVLTIQNKEAFSLKLKFENDSFSFESEDGASLFRRLDYSGGILSMSEHIPTDISFIKYYKFKSLDKFPETGSDSLLPPDGANMFSVVMASREFRKTVSNFFKDFGFQVVMKPQEKKFEIQKQIEDIVFSYPYALTSDTLQRIIFHTIAIESNENAALIFEEPESHSFPYYTKFLGEKIAFDRTNQYFIATHNPYLLSAILEKAPANTVNVCIAYFKDYQTKIRQLTEEQLPELIDDDPFFNISSFLEDTE